MRGASGPWNTAQIDFEIDGAVTANQRPPSRIVFTTNLSNTAQAERLRIRGDGNIMPGADAAQDLGQSTTVLRWRNIFASGCTGSQCSDVAENYKVTDEAIEAGDLVAVDDEHVIPSQGTNANAYVKKTSRAYDNGLIGVISTKPGIRLDDGEGVALGKGGIYFGQNEPDERPVALSGRVPVKVSLENGPINIGDHITSSSMPGVGMKATQDGQTIGIALEEFSISNFQFSNNDSNSNDQNTIGKILIFVNLGYSKLTVENGLDPNAPTPLTLESLAIRVDIIEQRVLALELKLDSSGSVTQDSNSPTPPLIVRGGDGGGVTSPAGFLASLQSAFETLGAKLQDGMLEIKEVIAEKIIAKKAVLEEIELKDQATSQIHCVKIENGILVTTPGECADSISAPQALNDESASTTVSETATTTDFNATTTEAGQSATVTAPTTQGQ